MSSAEFFIWGVSTIVELVIIFPVVFKLIKLEWMAENDYEFFQVHSQKKKQKNSDFF